MEGAIDPHKDTEDDLSLGLLSPKGGIGPAHF